MFIRRTLQLKGMHEGWETRVAAYWQVRGCEVRHAGAGTLLGTRGSLTGRLFSTNPFNWPTTVTVRPTQPGAMAIDWELAEGVGGLNEWNRPLLDLEWDLFREFVTSGDADLSRIEPAARSARRSVLRNLPRLSIGLVGPPRLRQDLDASTVLALGTGILSAAAAYVAVIEMLALSAPDALATHSTWPLIRLVFSLVLCPAAAISAACFARVVRHFHLRGQSLRCLTVEDAAERLGQPASAVRESIERRGLKPQFVVDGLPVYDAVQVTQAGLLLRPADAPRGDRLLRPADPAQRADRPDLLRPADGEQVAGASTAQ